MCGKFLKYLLRLSVIILFFQTVEFSSFRQNFSLLTNFTCDVANYELENHPEMQTIAFIELENNFPSHFSREVLKCLPKEVATVIINLHFHIKHNNTFKLSKHTLVIYIADGDFWVTRIKLFKKNFLLNFL